MIDGWGISCEIVIRWMSLDLTDDKSTLVQVMAWCRQATSHYLNQCWPRSISPYGVTGPRWVNYIPFASSHWSVFILMCYDNILVRCDEHWYREGHIRFESVPESVVKHVPWVIMNVKCVCAWNSWYGRIVCELMPLVCPSELMGAWRRRGHQPPKG